MRRLLQMVSAYWFHLSNFTSGFPNVHSWKPFNIWDGHTGQPTCCSSRSGAGEPCRVLSGVLHCNTDSKTGLGCRGIRAGPSGLGTPCRLGILAGRTFGMSHQDPTCKQPGTRFVCVRCIEGRLWDPTIVFSSASSTVRCGPYIFPFQEACRRTSNDPLELIACDGLHNAARNLGK